MTQAELAPPLQTTESRSSLGIIAAAAILVVLSVGLSMGGQVGRFAATGLVYTPAIVLAGLLQLRRWKGARVLSWMWFWLMLLSVAGVSFGMASGAAGAAGGELDPRRLIGPSLAIVGIVLVGIVVAATPLWVTLARALGAHGIDPAHPGHAQGTVGLLIGSALALAPLALLGGRAPLLDLLNQIDTSSIGMVEQVVDQVSSVAWTILLVLGASAWPTRVDLRGALARLGVTPLRVRDALPLAGITLVLVGLGFALDFVSRAVFTWLGWPTTDASVVTRLVSVATTPLGALVIALCAGVSEELLFRGLLQPRFGWLLANIGFAAMHAFQYGLDGLVAVFIIGSVLAFVRQRWNTTASIGVHVGYDLILLLLAQLGF